ncbi:MAG: DUF2927 domain-containing protein [Pseudomonadota bacterium]
MVVVIEHTSSEPAWQARSVCNTLKLNYKMLVGETRARSAKFYCQPAAKRVKIVSARPALLLPMTSRLSRILLVAVCGLAVDAAAARADPKRVDYFLKAFDETALWHDGRVPVAVRKWTGPIRVRMTGPMSSSYADMVLETLDKMAGLAGITVDRLQPDATDENFLVKFLETSALFAGGRRAGCVTNTRWGSNSALTKAELHINLSQGFGLKACIVHELMHAMGFPGHPHDLDTVLSYVYRRDRLTEIDEMAIRVLYDSRITPGMYHLPALVAARNIIAAQLDVSGPGADVSMLGRTYLDGAVKTLIQFAEQGHASVQAQLGNAFFFGHYVAKDLGAGVRWWRLAADQKHSDAQFRLGLAAANGQGMPVSVLEAATWYRLAAERDPIEAYKWFALAAGRNHNLAHANRGKLAANLTAEQVEEGERRAAAWKPQQQGEKPN